MVAQASSSPSSEKCNKFFGNDGDNNENCENDGDNDPESFYDEIMHCAFELPSMGGPTIIYGEMPEM